MSSDPFPGIPKAVLLSPVLPPLPPIFTPHDLEPFQFHGHLAQFDILRCNPAVERSQVIQRSLALVQVVGEQGGSWHQRVALLSRFVEFPPPMLICLVESEWFLRHLLDWFNQAIVEDNGVVPSQPLLILFRLLNQLPLPFPAISPSPTSIAFNHVMFEKSTLIGPSWVPYANGSSIHTHTHTQLRDVNFLHVLSSQHCTRNGGCIGQRLLWNILLLNISIILNK